MVAMATRPIILGLRSVNDFTPHPPRH